MPLAMRRFLDHPSACASDALRQGHGGLAPIKRRRRKASGGHPPCDSPGRSDRTPVRRWDSDRRRDRTTGFATDPYHARWQPRSSQSANFQPNKRNRTRVESPISSWRDKCDRQSPRIFSGRRRCRMPTRTLVPERATTKTASEPAGKRVARDPLHHHRARGRSHRLHGRRHPHQDSRRHLAGAQCLGAGTGQAGAD